MNFSPVHVILDEVQVLARQHFPKSRCEVQEASLLRLKTRILLSQGAFIDLFYAPRTERFDLALIVGGERRFGIDNLGRWHRHPVDKSEAHEPIEEPSLQETFEDVKRVVSAKRLLEKEPR